MSFYLRVAEESIEDKTKKYDFNRNNILVRRMREIAFLNFIYFILDRLAGLVKIMFYRVKILVK